MSTRKFVHPEFRLVNWESIKPYFDELLQRPINSLQDLEKFLEDSSELSAVIEEDLAWRYIQMTCDTENQEKAEHYKYFVTQIQPHIAPVSNKIDKKILASPFLEELRQNPDYEMMIKELQKEVELFREENVPIIAEIQALQQQYAQITGSMTVHIQGKEMTLQQANALLESPDRALREEAWIKINQRRYVDKEKLDELMTVLIGKRHQVALNAGFANYRDYAFKLRSRYDYTPQDCFRFHEAVKEEVVPLLNELALQRKQIMNLPTLRPWDKKADKTGKPPIKTFDTIENFIKNSIRALQQVDESYADVIRTMHELKRLDLDSRKGKAPGGYNYPLYESGYPFIFMNASGTVRDLVTMMHEAGHAVHSVLTKDLKLIAFKQLPAEIAELASMSMELLTMPYWHYFIGNDDPQMAQNVIRAQLDHLEDIIGTLPWVATVDKFQHWLYENPHHTVEERHRTWIEIADSFSDNITDMSGLEHFKAISWQRQLHIFEIPFYYIEYGIAQLGSIGVWKNFIENPQKAREQYKKALSLGYTRSLRKVYETAGVKFDFSAEYIRELMSFVRQKIDELNNQLYENIS
ncbi:MAG: M3 family oligoendopeptidase [Cytophagales bacterium]|nr:M3 family oligoendopeptidase [Cytophagales bacterium]MDW8383796.1 M3 family oligoendopeptidase [Flammeovirgaceae bacterium]